MALNTTVLGALMKSKVDAIADVDVGDRQRFFDALAAAVVEHVQAAAAVTVVTTCGSGAGSGTGTVA